MAWTCDRLATSWPFFEPTLRVGGRSFCRSISSRRGRICDRFVLLSAGKIVGEGALDELRETTRIDGGGLEEVFLALT